MKKERGVWEKYRRLLEVELAQFGVYRLNFVLWRVRAVLSVLVLYFLWWTVFSGKNEVFDYSKAQILTYVLGVAVMRSFVLASRGSGDVSVQIVTGDLVNWLLKPIGYMKAAAVRSLADKLVNLGFTAVEIGLLILLFRPPLFWQTSGWLWLGFALSLLVGMVLFFVIDYGLSLLSFWTPQDWWSPKFVFLIILEFLAGWLFPIDILPKGVVSIFSWLPFQYLLFFPMQVYLGRVAPLMILRGLVVGGVWIGIFYWLARWGWRKGLRSYSAWGR